MDDILILRDKKGGTAVLTTDSPASHYGIPVLRIEAEDVDGDFGPSDLIGEIPHLMTAASIIAAWAGKPERTDAERSIADTYLRQWPEGPQVSDRSMREHLREAGSVKSKKKAASSRANGKRGGKPPGPQPWKAEGISRQAWYARQKRGRPREEKGK